MRSKMDSAQGRTTGRTLRPESIENRLEEAVAAASPDAVPPGQTPPPLFVDMDGTLVAGDVLWELIFQAIKTKPLLLLRVPFWLMRGRAFVKQQLASRVCLDPRSLPYQQTVITLLRRERERGREVVLATAADRVVAERIAGHVGLFSAVLASDGCVNLSGRAKLAAIASHAQGTPFDYIGNCHADLPIWRRARRAILVQPSRGVMSKVRTAGVRSDILVTRSGLLGALIRMLRVHQWSKNVLVLVPLLLAHQASDPERMVQGILAFIAFSLAASAVYIVNDLIDLESDRRHPVKRARPIAAGAVPIPVALAVLPIAIALSVVGSILLLPALFTGTLLLYLGATSAYSARLKKVAILDVLLLAGLYTVRVLGGAFATDVPVSPWFLAFSMFFFLSLAFVKRYAELRLAGQGTEAEGYLLARGYLPTDADLLRSVGAASGYLGVGVLALYINSPEVHALYSRPGMLWLIGPLLLYWVTRVWLLAHRGQLQSDPVVFALKDWSSYVLGGLIAILLVVASFV
jgi:4-hydroxybenzoate polyprenyltransferase/phosphoserine phosphatase